MSNKIQENTKFSRNISMEMSISEASSIFPGFRFCPTDEELIEYYLKKKLEGSHECVELIPEVDICKHEPWELPARSIIQSDSEWFFFSPRGRKYPNGSQSKRATGTGHWKATGRERDVKSGSNLVGMKRTLVFHSGRAPRGQRTEWIMHEFAISAEDEMVVCRVRRNREFQLSHNPRRTSPSSGVEQSSSGFKTTGSCSKDATSSHNSHSVDQMETGSESDNKVTNVCSQEAYPSVDNVALQSNSEEDDWFADIMNDDIITLDDPSHLTTAAIKPRSEMMSKKSAEANAPLPFQGTANRRLRLRRCGPEHNRDICINDAQESQTDHQNNASTNSNNIHLKLPFVMIILLLIILSAVVARLTLYRLASNIPARAYRGSSFDM